MASTNKPYKNIFNETVTVATIVSDMISELNNRVASGESQLTDVNVGSELRNIYETSAVGIFRLLYENNALGRMLFLRYASNEFLDDLAYQVGLSRKNGTYAGGTVTFSIATVLNVDYIISSGTAILNRVTGNRYRLEDDVVIKAGTTWATGYVVAEGLGSAYNCGVGELTAFDVMQDLRGDIRVTNDFEITNGTDVESDNDFRNRIRNMFIGGNFGSMSYYEEICKNVDGVHDVKFIAPEVLNGIEQGRHSVLNSENNMVVCNDCTAVCVVNGNGSVETESMMFELAKILTNQQNLILGHEFHIQQATEEKYYFKINYYATQGTVGVTEEEIMQVLSAVFYGGTYEGEQTIEYTGFEIGQTITKYMIIEAIENMENVAHVENIKLLCWHENLPVIQQLERYVNDNHLYGATNQNPFTYNSILDFPDSDDLGFVQANCPVPAWHQTGTLGTSDMGTYELAVDGFYFYKLKDNYNQYDNNAGEFPLSIEEEDYWQWGEKDFVQIESEVDCIPKIASLHELDNNGHLVELNKLN